MMIAFSLPSASRKYACSPSLNFVPRDRKSTRLNSSHVESSYAVFCLKKKKVCDTCGELMPNHADDCNDLNAILNDVELHVTRFVSFGSRHRAIAVALLTAHVYAHQPA